MPGKWDTSTKRLVGENPEDFIRWLVPEAQFEGKAKARPLNLNDREIEADTLYEIVLYGIPCLVHIEFQSYYDESMDRRMWEYNALATFSYNRPTCSFVIYLKKCEVPEPFFTWEFPTREVIHHFHFHVIKLWEISPELLKQTSLVGILPLMVLARDGKRPAVVEEVIRSIESLGGEAKKELLSLTYVFASLVFEKEVDRQWLKRRFEMLRDVLRDSWAYQEIMQEGRQEGREEERQQRLQDQRQMLVALVEVHFPSITQLARERADAMKDPEMLQRVILKVVAAQKEEEVIKVLLSVRRTGDRKKKKK